MNNEQNIHNYHLCKGSSLTFAPRIIRIVPLNMKINLPRLIKVRKICYIDFQNKGEIQSICDIMFSNMLYPVWVNRTQFESDRRYLLTELLCPVNKTDDIINIIKNIPAKIGALYDNEERKTYIKVSQYLMESFNKSERDLTL